MQASRGDFLRCKCKHGEESKVRGVSYRELLLIEVLSLLLLVLEGLDVVEEVGEYGLEGYFSILLLLHVWREGQVPGAAFLLSFPPHMARDCF